MNLLDISQLFYTDSQNALNFLIERSLVLPQIICLCSAVMKLKIKKRANAENYTYICSWILQ